MPRTHRAGPTPTGSTSSDRDPRAIFDRQVDDYRSLGVPALHGVTDAQFEDLVAPLRAALPSMPGPSTHEALVGEAPAPAADAQSTATPAGRLPLILVVPGVAAERLMPLTVQGAQHGYVDMRPVDSTVFQPVPEAGITWGAYVLLDVDTGQETLNIRPADAGRWLADRGRLPLTIDEGIAALLLNPGLLRAANCYQMLGSRDGSKRIPSLWVTGRGVPRLGWCFDRVPHTWLGSASCAARITA